MEPTFYSCVSLFDLALDPVASSYIHWLLGLDDYASIRGRRLASGVARHWTATELLAGGSFHGAHDCVVEARRGGETFLLRFVHRDSDPKSAVLWHNQVRVTKAQKGVTLEHGVARSAPRGTVFNPVAAPPTVFKNILKKNGQNVWPKEFFNPSALRVPSKDVEHFAGYVLFDPERTAPLLLLTPTSDTGKFLVDANKVADRLAGLAPVAVLSEDEATFALRGYFESRGMSRKFGCFDGAAKLYVPKINKNDTPFRHVLWPREWIEEIDPKERIDKLCGAVAARVVTRTMPLGFFRWVERFDREERAKFAQELLREKEPDPDDSAALQERELTITKLRESLTAAQKDADELLATTVKLEDDVRGAWEMISELEEKLSDANVDAKGKSSVIECLNETIELVKAEKAKAGLGAEQRDAMSAALTGTATPEQALIVLAALYSDRVVILPSAFRSAKKSKDLNGKHLSKAFTLLRDLATRYWTALKDGKSDDEAGRVFGNAYAPTDNIETDRAEKLRTFSHNGKNHVMVRHLKIGVKPSFSDTFRVHFEWFAKEKTIVIGHCGPHLDHD